MNQKKKNKIRVLHLPSAVGGNGWNLSVAERKLGIDSKLLNIGNNKFGFPCDIKKEWNNKLLYPIRAISFYIKEINNYDVFHFNFGRTIFDYRFNLINMIDLIYLKKKKKKIVFTYQGSDARLAKYCLENYEVTYFKNFDKTQLKIELKNDKRKIARFKKVNKYADIIYATNPDLLNVLPSKTLFRPYTKLQIEDFIPKYSDYGNKELVIAHAPTNRKIKGTEEIIKIVEKLKKKHKIKLLLIENKNNEDTIKELKNSDLVIDQLYAGWYGGLAVEAMALGKPVIAYIRESDLTHIPPKMAKELPIINANNKNLEFVLNDILNSPKQLEIIAKASRNYVENWHDSKKNAKKIIADYENFFKSSNIYSKKQKCDKMDKKGEKNGKIWIKEKI